MKLLSDNSLCELLTRCHFHSGYKGLIVFGTIENVKNFIEAFKNLNSQEHIPGIIGISGTHNGGQYRIGFRDGSNIQIIAQCDVDIHIWHYRRVHEVLYSSDINADVYPMLWRTIIPYRDRGDINLNETISKLVYPDVFTTPPTNEQDGFESQDSDELDNFLKSFSINK